MPFFKKNKLVTAILIALILGILTGYLYNKYYTDLENSLLNSTDSSAVKSILHNDFKQIKENVAFQFSILSEIFLRLIKMIIAPLVLSVLISGVGKIENISTLGRIGIKTMVYFYVMTFIALLLGLLSVNLFQPGTKMHLEIPTKYEIPVQKKGFDAHEFITHVIPDSIFNALAKNDILPIVVFSVLFSISACSTKK